LFSKSPVIFGAPGQFIIFNCPAQKVILSRASIIAIEVKHINQVFWN